MSTWTDDAQPVRRSSRRMSLQPSDVESIASGSSTPSSVIPRKLLVPKSSLIPRLKQIEEKMIPSDDELFNPAPIKEVKKRGRPRSPTKKMTGASSKRLSAAAAAEGVEAAPTTPAAAAAGVKKERARSRSSSRSRRATPVRNGTAAAPAAKFPQPVFDVEESPMVTRRSTRLATKAQSNGHAVLNGTHKDTPAVARQTTEQWATEFRERHPFVAKVVIPALICLVYAAVIIGAAVYFDLHRKAPIWLNQAASSIHDMYDEFMQRRAAAAAAAGIANTVGGQ